MNLSSITNSNSINYSQQAPSSGTSSSNPQGSLFAQMLKNSAGTTAAGGTAKSSSSNPNQLLTQLMGSFQSNGVQNEAQSLDPMSML